MFAGLQLRGGGREKHQVDAIRNGESLTALSASKGPATKTICRSGPAPIACANCCKAMVKTSTLTRSAAGANTSLLFQDARTHTRKAIHTAGVLERAGGALCVPRPVG